MRFANTFGQYNKRLLIRPFPRQTDIKVNRNLTGSLTAQQETSFTNRWLQKVGKTNCFGSPTKTPTVTNQNTKKSKQLALNILQLILSVSNFPLLKAQAVEKCNLWSRGTWCENPVEDEKGKLPALDFTPSVQFWRDACDTLHVVLNIVSFSQFSTLESFNYYYYYLFFKHSANSQCHVIHVFFGWWKPKFTGHKYCPTFLSFILQEQGFLMALRNQGYQTVWIVLLITQDL